MLDDRNAGILGSVRASVVMFRVCALLSPPIHSRRVDFIIPLLPPLLLSWLFKVRQTVLVFSFKGYSPIVGLMQRKATVVSGTAQLPPYLRQRRKPSPSFWHAFLNRSQEAFQNEEQYSVTHFKGDG
ncbi:hypothetical protein TcWFU_002398 [Taenia crassiceps]|uniref:Uncharacterized protein n=1 Tax=Taenia crassiceps TaxID=6207 RepID=A0ABR4Q963_9CEST